MLQNAYMYFLAKFGFDTAESEPAKNLQTTFAIWRLSQRRSEEPPAEDWQEPAKGAAPEDPSLAPPWIPAIQCLPDRDDEAVRWLLLGPSSEKYSTIAMKFDDNSLKFCPWRRPKG